MFVAFTACGGGGSSEEPQPLPNPVATLSITENFPVMDEEIEISYTCANLPANYYEIVFSENTSIYGSKAQPETVLFGFAYRIPNAGRSGPLQIGWGDHFFQNPNTFSNMTFTGRVNFSPTEFSFGEYLASGLCSNTADMERIAYMNLTFTVLPGNFDLEVFDYAEFQ